MYCFTVGKLFAKVNCMLFSTRLVMLTNTHLIDPSRPVKYQINNCSFHRRHRNQRFLQLILLFFNAPWQSLFHLTVWAFLFSTSWTCVHMWLLDEMWTMTCSSIHLRNHEPLFFPLGSGVSLFFFFSRINLDSSFPLMMNPNILPDRTLIVHLLEFNLSLNCLNWLTDLPRSARCPSPVWDFAIMS
jgi:hypothetical protein